MLKQENNKGVLYSYTIPAKVGQKAKQGKSQKSTREGALRPRRPQVLATDPNAVQGDETPQQSAAYRAHQARLAQRQQHQRQLDQQRRQQLEQERKRQLDHQRQLEQQRQRQIQSRVVPQQPASNRNIIRHSPPRQQPQRQDARYNTYNNGGRQPAIVPARPIQTYPSQQQQPLKAPYRQPQVYQPVPGDQGAVYRGPQAQGPVYVRPDYQVPQTQGHNLGTQAQQGYNRRYPYTGTGQHIIPAQPQRTVNDQIALGQPSVPQRQWVGQTFGGASNYQWKISGFTECTQPCGEGKCHGA